MVKTWRCGGRGAPGQVAAPVPPDDFAQYSSSLGVFVCTLYHILSQSGQRVSLSSVSCSSQSVAPEQGVVAPEQGVVGVVGTSDLKHSPSVRNTGGNLDLTLVSEVVVGGTEPSPGR